MGAAGPSALRRAGLWVLLAALVLGFLALSAWQLQRRSWKLALIERVDQRVHAAPIPLPVAARWPDIGAAGYEYLPVSVHGRWLPAHTLLSQAVTELGSGFWVMTPLQQADGSSVWINRGFIPEAQRAAWLSSHARAASDADNDADSVQVSGLLRMNEREQVETLFRDHYNIPLVVVDAEYAQLVRHLDSLACGDGKHVCGSTIVCG